MVIDSSGTSSTTETDSSGTTGSRRYKVVALEVPVVFNRDGDHDHNGLIYALEQDKGALDLLRTEFRNAESPSRYTPHPLVRPLVLRARVGETVTIKFENHVRGRRVGIHLVADGYDVQDSDGAHVGSNPSSLAGPPEGPAGSNRRTYRWQCLHEGVYPFHDAGNLSGGEEGTNVHGLFGALVVEPVDSAWSDPVSGDRLDEPLPANGDADQQYWAGDGLYADVHPKGWVTVPDHEKKPFDQPPPKYPFGPGPGGDASASFREFVVFFHDEAEFQPAHRAVEPDPCRNSSHGHGDHGGDGCCAHSSQGCDSCCGSSSRGNDERCRRVDHGGRGPGADGGGHGGHGGGSEHEGPLPIMTISYRSEPMINRERKLWRMIREGTLLKPVIGEEQHHSSWLFGEPATPVLRSYAGDPVRIRFVHGGVKETHVFHQHVYQWHADPANRNSPIIDSVTVGPQTGHTIEFLFGAGSQQGAIGDAIFHCHLYPHFHEGMWGITRTFDRWQIGKDSAGNDKVYPDGSPLEALEPLLDRQPPPFPTATNPGYPFFIPGQFGQKSPVPPWPSVLPAMAPDLDYRPPALVTALEMAQLNTDPRPGALFNLHPFDRTLNAHPVPRELAVVTAPVEYNRYGWQDPHGHLFVLAADAEAAEQGGHLDPLVVRGNRNTVVEISLSNRLPATFPGTAFDVPFPPCDFYPTPLGEC